MKFKVGDEVVCTKGNEFVKAGNVGTVIKTSIEGVQCKWKEGPDFWISARSIDHTELHDSPLYKALR